MKRIRLDPQAYRTGHCFSITIATHLRRPLFARPVAADLGISILREVAARLDVEVFAYCLMPNHLHLLAAASSPVSAWTFVDRYKQISGFRVKRLLGLRHSVWQARFYDHALRSDEDVERVANYILDNPVRAELAASRDLYPYSGSLVWPDLFPSEAKATDLHPPEAPGHATVVPGL